MSSTTVSNKIYLKESWIASLSLAMTILKIRNVIAKECICTTVAIHFCYLILFYFVVLLYILITGFIRDSSGNEFMGTMTFLFSRDSEQQEIYVFTTFTQIFYAFRMTQNYLLNRSSHQGVDILLGFKFKVFRCLALVRGLF